MKSFLFIVLFGLGAYAAIGQDVCIVYADNPAEDVSFQTINGPVIINPQGSVEVKPTSYVYPAEQVGALIDSILEIRYDSQRSDDRRSIETLKKQVNELIFSQRSMEGQLSSAIAQIEILRKELMTAPPQSDKVKIEALLTKAESVIATTQDCLSGQVPVEEEEVSPQRYRFRIKLEDLENLPGIIVQFDPQEGMVRVKRNNRYGYYNEKGDLTIPFKYEQASDFHEGEAFVSRN